MQRDSEKKGKKITIKDVASASGVSIATVSYVLNNTPGQSISEATRKKVLQFANILGYECNSLARYLATGKTNTVAAVVKDMSLFAVSYYMPLAVEMSRILVRRNMQLKLLDQTDGLAYNGTACDAYVTLGFSEKEFRAFADTKYVPVIAVDSVFHDFLFYRINDDYQKMYETAKKSADGKPVELLCFELPDECMSDALKYFDGVTQVRSISDTKALRDDACYCTTVKALAELAPDRTTLCTASCVLKASAAVDAVIRAIERIITSSEDHDIRV